MSDLEPITIDQMYADGHLDYADEVLDRSRAPRGPGMLYAIVDDLDLGPGDVVLDIGGRDAVHSLSLVAMFDCDAVSVDPVETNNVRARAAVAEHPLGDRVTIRPGTMEAIPAADDEFDLVFSRDMFFQVVQADAALADTRRVLKPGGHVLLSQSFATDRLEPLERAHLFTDLAVAAERMSPQDFERRAVSAGFVIESVDIVGSQWREAWEEDGTRLTSRQLLHSARLLRKHDELRAEFGAEEYRVELADALWGVYHMIGKLETRVYLLRNPGGTTL